MINEKLKAVECCDHNTPFELNDIIDSLVFNGQGLIPVITQDASSKVVLMFAWMTKGALMQTIATQQMVYWSRSRKQLWRKGESSGHTQKLVSMSFDCDGDVVLCSVNQKGAACHTGRPNCFYLEVDVESQRVVISGNAQ